MRTRIAKPWGLDMPEKEWNNLTPEQQIAVADLHAPNMGGKKPKRVLSQKPSMVSNSSPVEPSQSNASLVSKEAVSKPKPPTLKENKIVPNYDLLGIRNWTEDVTSAKTGKVYLANRVRDCLVYQFDVVKNRWWITNATKSLVKINIDKLNDDTPEDFFYEKNPLFMAKKVRVGEEEHLLWVILRNPKDETERMRIRNKFGINPQTAPYLAKKDCQKCQGKGSYTVSSYPDDPIYKSLTESIECQCIYE